MQLLGDRFVGQLFARKGHQLIEHGECIPQGAIGFLGDDMKGLFFCSHPFLRRNVLQMGHRIRHRNAVKIKNLAPGQYGGKDFMLLGGGQNENSMRWGLFKRFQEGIECGLAQHVHLVDDVHLVLALLWRDPHLLNNASDVFHFVVRRCIELKHIEGHGLIRNLKTIDGTRKNPR